MPANDTTVSSTGQPGSADLAASAPNAAGVPSSTVPPDDTASVAYSGDPGISGPPANSPHTPVVEGPVAAPVEESDSAQQAVAGRDLVIDIAACANCASGKELFPLMTEKWDDILCVAYPASLHLKANLKAAWDEARKSPAMACRKRAPSRASLASFAIQLATDPATQTEKDACYEQAYFLIWADIQNVLPDDFPGWLANITQQECKDAVRALRKEKKGDGPVAPKAQIRLSLTYGGSGKPAPITVPLSAAQAAAIDTFLASRTEAFEDPLHMFGALRDVLQKVRKVGLKTPAPDVEDGVPA